MPHKEEYELMPVKPIRELKKEIQKLKNELKKEDGSSKVLTKVLNSNIQIQKKIEAMLKENKRISDNLKNVVSVFESFEAEEEENVKEDVQELKEQNKQILQKLDDLNSVLQRATYFKERFPRGANLVYRRTK